VRVLLSHQQGPSGSWHAILSAVIPLLLVASLFVTQTQARPAQPFDARSQVLFDDAVADFEDGKVRDAVEKFDELAVRMPATASRLWQRGLALYYVGRYEDCAEQFAANQKYNPSNVENLAWHFVCVARAESFNKARASVLSIVPDTSVPMRELYDLLRGLTTPEAVLAAAKATGRPDAEFDAHYYLGLYYEALGDAERTRIHITAAAADRFASFGMHSAARVHLRQLQRKR
jgi:tetratricopeptide (TPR) repeat protein